MREKTIYEKIAEKYNTTPEEVRREMQIAIDAGKTGTDDCRYDRDEFDTCCQSEDGRHRRICKNAVDHAMVR